MRRSTAGPLLLLVTLASCEVTTPQSEPDLRVETSEEVLALPSDGPLNVTFAITNRGTMSAFLSRCGERIMAALDREEGGSWVQSGGGLCLAVHDMSPLEIVPGETLHGHRTITEAGTWRLRIGVSPSPGASARWTLTSNRFTVH